MKSALSNLVSGFILKHIQAPSPLPLLAQEVEQARQEWLTAQNYYNNVSDADLVDHAAYLLQATEKKYTYLLKRARNEGVTYSPFN